MKAVNLMHSIILLSLRRKTSFDQNLLYTYIQHSTNGILFGIFDAKLMLLQFFIKFVVLNESFFLFFFSCIYFRELKLKMTEILISIEFDSVIAWYRS